MPLNGCEYGSLPLRVSRGTPRLGQPSQVLHLPSDPVPQNGSHTLAPSTAGEFTFLRPLLWSREPSTWRSKAWSPGAQGKGSGIGLTPSPKDRGSGNSSGSPWLTSATSLRAGCRRHGLGEQQPVFAEFGASDISGRDRVLLSCGRAAARPAHGLYRDVRLETTAGGLSPLGLGRGPPASSGAASTLLSPEKRVIPLFPRHQSGLCTSPWGTCLAPSFRLHSARLAGEPMPELPFRTHSQPLLPLTSPFLSPNTHTWHAGTSGQCPAPTPQDPHPTELPVPKLGLISQQEQSEVL